MPGSIVTSKNADTVRLFAVCSAFFLLSLVFCRRFFDLADWNSHYLMDGDPGLNAWALDWVTHALTTTPGAILDGNAFFPYPKSIALSEHMLSLALINVFVKPFGSSPWYGYNFLIFLAYFASAVGGFLVVREWTGSARAGIWAGVFWGFLFFRVHHVSHLQILSFEWIPFCVLFLLRLARSPSLKNWFGFVFFFLMQALVSWYLAVITSFLILVVVLGTVDKTMLDRRRVLLALSAVAVFAVALGLLAVPYLAVGQSTTLADRMALVLRAGSKIHLDGYFFPPDATLIGSRIPGNRHWVWGENTLYLGYLPLLLALGGLIPDQRRGLRPIMLGVALVLAGAVLAVGFATGDSRVKLPLYYLAQAVPFLAGLRATQRFSILIYFGVMLLSSLAIARFEEVRSAKKPFLMTLGVVLASGLFLLEVYPVKLPYDTGHQKFEFSVIDRDIDRIQEAMGRRIAVIHYPIYYFSQSYPLESEAKYLVGSTLHRAFIVNGFSGAEPAGWMDDLRTYNEIPEAKAFALMKERNIDLICLHSDLPSEKRKLILEHFQQQNLGEVLLSDAQGNVILRLRGGRSPVPTMHRTLLHEVAE